MPAVKKHPTARARRNTAPTAATMGQTSTRRGPKPKLPVRAPGEDWHAAVTAWWTDLWSAPMSDEYHTSDIHQLYALAELYQAYWLTPITKVRDRLLLHAEIRMARASFGLTPYDRRRLEWSIETVEAAQDRGKARRTAARPPAAPPAPGDDPRTALRVV